MNTNIKILISDDSVFMRKILRGIIEEAGFSQVFECGNGKECLEKYEAEKPDLILLDLIMPQMDGLEVLKKIGREAKILVISSVGQDKIIEDAKKFGAKGYLLKPFEDKKVLEEIKKVIG